MTVYIVHRGTLNSGYECHIHGVFGRLKLAEDVVKCFPYEILSITEFEVIV